MAVDDMGGELVRERLWFDDGFTTIPNTWARDPHITNQARGLLVQVASHTAGFRISIAALVAGSLNGREAIRSQLSELQHAGYLERSVYRVSNLKRYRYRLRDPHAPVGADGQATFNFPNRTPPKRVHSPSTRPPGMGQSSSTGFPYTENPTTGPPSTGFPSTENPTAIEEQSKNINNVLEVTTEVVVDNSCWQGHAYVKGELFCPLGHYSTEREIERRKEATS